MTPQIKCFLLPLAALLAVTLGAVATAADAAGGKFWVFVGTYTQRNASKGIYRCELDTATGKLSVPQLAADPPVAPAGVLGGQPHDQPADLGRERGPAGPAAPTEGGPLAAGQLAVPAQ